VKEQETGGGSLGVLCVCARRLTPLLRLDISPRNFTDLCKASVVSFFFPRTTLRFNKEKLSIEAVGAVHRVPSNKVYNCLLRGTHPKEKEVIEESWCLEVFRAFRQGSEDHDAEQALD
jgi:hypothetical protein